MQLTKTIILKLDVPDNDLAELLKSFSHGMNYASKIAFDIGKPVGSGQLQKVTYHHLRTSNASSSQVAKSRTIETSDPRNAEDCRRQAVDIWALDPLLELSKK